jgi:hypothetical protein
VSSTMDRESLDLTFRRWTLFGDAAAAAAAGGGSGCGGGFGGGGSGGGNSELSRIRSQCVHVEHAHVRGRRRGGTQVT